MSMLRKLTVCVATAATTVSVLAVGQPASASAGPVKAVSAGVHADFVQLSQLVEAKLAAQHAQSLLPDTLSADGGISVSGCETDGPIFGPYAAELDRWTDKQRATVSDLSDIAQFYAGERGNKVFGSDGQYTAAVTSTLTKLQSFWDFESWRVQARGWHGDVVFSVAKLTKFYQDELGQDADTAADAAKATVAEAKAVPDLDLNDPALTFNSTASPNGTIIMGDGIIDAYANAGFDGDTVQKFILGHEFGHEVQFATGWFEKQNDGPVIETGADALSGYFAAHAKGLHLNARDQQQIAYAANDIGDCHQDHGLPVQRRTATVWAEQLATTKAANPNKNLPVAKFLAKWDTEFAKKIKPLDPAKTTATASK